MNDLREVLENAYEEVDETTETATETATEDSTEAEVEAPSETAEKVSEEIPVAGEPDETPAPADEALAPADEALASADEMSAEDKALAEMAAPVSWNAQEREFWNEATPQVRAAIARREQEMNNALNTTAPVRKFGETMQEVLAPHEQMLAAQGSNPVQAVQRMLGVAQGLVQGDPQQKATMVAQLMKQYNVDVQVLADVISGATDSGQQAPQDVVAQQVEQQVAQRMQPYEQQQQMKLQQEAQRVQEEIASFAKEHEFYNDVRMQMADIMDLHEQQGRSTTLEDAYNMAVQMNTSVQAVQAKRAAQERENRQAAAGSLRSGGGAPPPQGHADTLRGNLLDAWDEATRG